MADRAVWKGTLALAGMFTIHLEALKATDSYAGNEPIKDLCACHTLPLDRSHRCAETMQPPARKVKGVERPDGTYGVLSDVQLESIKSQTEKEVIEPLALVPEGAWGCHMAADVWYLRGNRKMPGSEGEAQWLYAALAKKKAALVCKLVKGGRDTYCAITATDGKLIASRLRYAQEVREPEEYVREVAEGEVAPKALELADILFGELPSGFDISQHEDTMVVRKRQVIASVLAGESAPVEPTGVSPSEPSGTPDLMAKLLASVEAVEAQTGKRPAKRAKAPDKEGVKA